MDRHTEYEPMDDSLDEDEFTADEDEDEFVEFVSRRTGRNRNKELRDYIERREVSRRLREDLGLDLFELPTDY